MLFELIQVALGCKDRLSLNPTEEEWRELYANSIKQAVAGVAFEGVQKLPREQWPPQCLLFEWIGMSEQIKAQNKRVNKRCLDICNLFNSAGFRTCILKGQGNALMYPNPYSRTSGDIDIWVEGNREDIRDFVIAKCPNAEDGSLHIHFPIFSDVEVEVHYNARQTTIPKYNKRLQAWIKKEADAQFENYVHLPEMHETRISVPTLEFNVILQLFHIKSHFFIEGIGLRHFVDFFYLLKKCYSENVFANTDRVILHEMGLEKFASGVMWIEKECLGLNDKYLLIGPSEKIGKVLLREIEEGGNFGHYDKRYIIRNNGVFLRGIADFYRLLRLAIVFPSESFWKTIDKITNQKWKLK